MPPVIRCASEPVPPCHSPPPSGITDPASSLMAMAEPVAWLALDAQRHLAWLGELGSAMPAFGVLFGGVAFGGGAADGEVSPPGWRPRARRSALLLGAAGLLFAAFGLTPAGAAWWALPSPFFAGAVLGGLFLVGASLAPVGPRSGPGWLAKRMATSVRRGALLLVLAWAADGAASGWGRLQPAPPWSPGVASVLLDLSPRSLLMESGGVDWMRHPAVYEPVGTDRIGPGLRSVYAGPVAGSLTLLVGCMALAARRVLSRRRARR